MEKTEKTVRGWSVILSGPQWAEISSKRLRNAKLTHGTLTPRKLSWGWLTCEYWLVKYLDVFVCMAPQANVETLENTYFSSLAACCFFAVAAGLASTKQIFISQGVTTNNLRVPVVHFNHT